MTILPLSTPGRNTPTQHQNASYFPTQQGPTIGIPTLNGEGFGRRKSDGLGGYSFGGSNSGASGGRVHHSGGIAVCIMADVIPLYISKDSQIFLQTHD
ncbi:hypothetical protein BGZ49_001481 [Haplosporangium sp. Z 27]|nr:hypothetical protein BGZ49_001481 [Haplosporangium sp. Z 27]